jgi:hypothetical protein
MSQVYTIFHTNLVHTLKFSSVKVHLITSSHLRQTSHEISYFQVLQMIFYIKFLSSCPMCSTHPDHLILLDLIALMRFEYYRL